MDAEKHKVKQGYMTAVAALIGAVIGGAVVPIVIALVGNFFASAIKEREVEGKFVELAVGILRDAPDANSAPIREWATKIIDNYSGVPMSAEVREQLVNKRPLGGGAVPRGSIPGNSVPPGVVPGLRRQDLPD